MHGLSRLGTGSNRSVSPSPPSSPRFRHGRYKNFAGGGGGVGRGGKQSAANKIVFVLISTVFRRKGVLLFAPLLYISGMLLYMGLLGFDVVSLKNAVVVVHRRSPPGSVYRSPQLFQKLWPYMEAESNATHNALMTAWNLKMHQGWKPCVNSIISKTGFSELPKSNGFLIIEANGGLNQQRLSICDAVAVAWLLNATLVIPIFHLNSVWRDSRLYNHHFLFIIHILTEFSNLAYCLGVVIFCLLGYLGCAPAIDYLIGRTWITLVFLVLLIPVRRRYLNRDFIDGIPLAFSAHPSQYCSFYYVMIVYHSNQNERRRIWQQSCRQWLLMARTANCLETATDLPIALETTMLQIINKFPSCFSIHCSKFGDIFDEEFFIHALTNHVNVVRELPEDVLQRFDNNISNIVNLRVKGWSNAAHYLQKVLPKLEAMGAVRIAPFSNRLAYSVPSNVQGVRCLSNFQALRFAEPIRTLADKMVERMVMNSSHTGGKYVSVHLRFETDMVAFSCCEYDGGEEEKSEMDIARERSWRGKFRRRGRVIRPGANRMDGKCPLTPLEVGLMLRGMGFNNNTSVFVAAGNIYKAEKYMAPLKQMFPLLETKDTLATPEELAPFKGHSSRLAALDYTVCLHSEVFVTTQGGNFPHFLMGHRRYLFGGHAKTIKPDKRKLALLFDSPHIRWETFRRQMKDMLRHSDVKGGELKKSSGSVYTFPMPDCMCKQTEAAANESSLSF
ncbi:hypothetical protein CXB51_005946 [Gossypium anomalum]|uniref:O-fucosyltransferase family protein n=1 Tax=Gossypium anomalum TaxID=47600 RepID=A0A8J5ZEG0_9ROSI|nr:hypothetical protein CXB51_005946 [Gossypium anomalum]